MIWRRRKPSNTTEPSTPIDVAPESTRKTRRKLSQRGLEEPFLYLSRRLGAAFSRRFPSAYSVAVQGRYAIELLLERRLWLFLIADTFLLLITLFAILGEGAKPYDFYRQAVILPYLLIGLPGLSAVLALERRAGSLDLALAVPSTERYFVRRVLPICLCLVIQGWSILALVLEDRGNLLRALIQSLVVALLLAALSLFWAVRLRTSGAVLAASLITVGLLGQWVLYNPMIDKSGGPPERILGIAVPILDWVWNLLILILATWILFQYARERLRRPETLIA